MNHIENQVTGHHDLHQVKGNLQIQQSEQLSNFRRCIVHNRSKQRLFKKLHIRGTYLNEIV